jgi:dipeptidyl aminopeptidase/acylaminoacyl peptidase
MRFNLFAVHCLLFLLSCTPKPQSSAQTFLYVYRFDSPAFVAISEDLQAIPDIPFILPPDCSLFDVFSAPFGYSLLVELSSPSGQTILFLDTESGSVTQPVTDSDSHFLAWDGDGEFAYLKVDSLGETRVVRAYPGGRREDLKITGWTYDLSSRPRSNGFVFTFSEGLGYGSELHSARGGGRSSKLLYKYPYHYIAFARYSPDGSRIAFIKIPDTQTPFMVGEMWVMDADGSNPRRLAEADAGHGYAANWSPDGEWIAFVKRENPQEKSADQSPDSLISNIYLVNVENGELKQVTSFSDGRAETPHWSPDGTALAFNTVLDGRMEVQLADVPTGEIRPLTAESTCCPAWMRK